MEPRREERVKAVVDRFVKELKEALEFDGRELGLAGGEAVLKAELSANPQRAWVRKQVPSPEASADDRDQVRACPQNHNAAINPRHEERTYVDVVMGQERDGLIADRRRALLENRDHKVDAMQWKIVQYKKSKRPPPSMRPPLQPLQPRRRSPPIIHTPSGPVMVCGQCLKPGHRADSCRRAITCRRCGSTGHRARECKSVLMKVSGTTGMKEERGSRMGSLRRTMQHREPLPPLGEQRQREKPNHG